MNRLENPMIFQGSPLYQSADFELFDVHECDVCGCEMEDEDEVFDDGKGVYCDTCLLNKYRMS